MKAGVKERIIRDERGFTLVEVLTTMMIMLVVMFALYSIFDMSIRVFRFGNDKIEAVENARLGLEKMEREIRAAYPYDLTSTPQKTHLFFTTSSPTTGAIPSSTQITFGNELNGNRKIECPATPTAANPREYITYKQVGNALQRVNTCSSADSGTAVVEFVKTNGLTFSYFEADGTSPESEDEITRVRIELQISVPGSPPRTQTLTTDVDLRSRS